jgi:uncharacterized protein (TIGR00369 family)
MAINTHKRIDPHLCGVPQEVKEGFSRVEMQTQPQMCADDSGLIHGGFIFGLADYAAMLAVNHPNVVLGGASVTFLKPVKLDDIVLADARVTSVKGKKQVVEVTVQRDNQKVFEGEFLCFVLDEHVLKN